MAGTALADSPPAPGLPGDTPGSNSSRATSGIFSEQNLPGYNFGHCQSQTAKAPGSASQAQDTNPALNTAGQPGFTAEVCTK
jgi:hypothetical protein